MRGEQQIFENVRPLCLTLNMSAGPGEERAFPPFHRQTTERSPRSSLKWRCDEVKCKRNSKVRFKQKPYQGCNMCSFYTLTHQGQRMPHTLQAPPEFWQINALQSSTIKLMCGREAKVSKFLQVSGEWDFVRTNLADFCRGNPPNGYPREESLPMNIFISSAKSTKKQEYEYLREASFLCYG